MKNRLSLIFAFLAFVAFTSCEDEPLVGTFIDETGVEGGSTSAATAFSVEVNNVAFGSVLNTSTVSNGKIILQGLNSGSFTLSVTVPETVTPGTYNIDMTDYKGFYGQTNGAVTANAYQGTITILTHDTNTGAISGTFTYTASVNTPPTPDYVITNGSFNLSY